MNVTFFVGNGFDLNLELKTKYSDFYPYFIENSSSENIIKDWLVEDDMDWADLELELGKKLTNLKDGAEDSFYSSKLELDNLLLDYLESEEKKVDFTEEEKISEELIRSLKEYCSALSNDGKTSIKDTLNTYNEPIKFQFVSFNYTNTLDRIIDICKTQLVNNENEIGKYHNARRNQNLKLLMGDVLHIHGTIDSEAILAVNDESQIHNDKLQKNSEFLDTFIKPRINIRLGQRKIQQLETTLDTSHVVCVFGMSVGETDKMWWEQLIKWLAANKNNKLIIYYKDFENTLRRRNPSTLIRLENKVINDFMLKGNVDRFSSQKEEIERRIILAFDSDIFSFWKKGDDDNTKSELTEY